MTGFTSTLENVCPINPLCPDFPRFCLFESIRNLSFNQLHPDVTPISPLFEPNRNSMKLTRIAFTCIFNLFAFETHLSYWIVYKIHVMTDVMIFNRQIGFSQNRGQLVILMIRLGLAPSNNFIGWFYPTFEPSLKRLHFIMPKPQKMNLISTRFLYKHHWYLDQLIVVLVSMLVEYNLNIRRILEAQ